MLLSQKLFPSPGVPSDGGWALLLPSFVLGDRGGRHLPCVKGEGEVGASSEGEGEHQSLVCQVLAEVKALGGQGGVLSNSRSSHFGELLLKYEIELGYQLNRHVSSSKVSTQLYILLLESLCSSVVNKTYIHACVRVKDQDHGYFAEGVTEQSADPWGPKPARRVN